MTWGLGALPGLSGGTACGDPFEGAVGMAQGDPGDMHKLPGAQMEASPESKDERPSPWMIDADDDVGARHTHRHHQIPTIPGSHTVQTRTRTWTYMQNILLH